MTPRFVVVGDVVTDVVARLQEPLAPGSDASASVAMGGGGSAANVAVWLACQHADVAFVGRTGDDAAGRARAEELRAAGVRVHLTVDTGRPTGTVVVIVDPDGQRTMLPDRAASAHLSPVDLSPRLFTAGAHLHLSGYTLLHAATRPAGQEALAMARAAGMSTSVDPSSAQPLRSVGADAFLAWTAGVDLVLPNLDEATVLTGSSEVADAARALAIHYPEVVITLGADGAVHCADGRLTHVPARATDAVDSTGAGDAFTAGYLAAAAADPAQRLAAGHRLAARAVSRAGGRPGAPSAPRQKPPT